MARSLLSSLLPQTQTCNWTETAIVKIRLIIYILPDSVHFPHLPKTLKPPLLSLPLPMELPSPIPNLDDYSASATTVPFDRPLPLLRGPILAAPSSSSFVLAFRDAAAWRIAFQACQSKIADQCEAAARIGCAMTAASKCRPPWWRRLVGPTVVDFAARERCEEGEMECCFAAAREKCAGFARERCLKSFREARVSVKGRGLILNRKRAEKLVSLATGLKMDKSPWIGLIGLDRDLGATNLRASELIGYNSDVDCVVGGSS